MVVERVLQALKAAEYDTTALEGKVEEVEAARRKQSSVVSQTTPAEMERWRSELAALAGQIHSLELAGRDASDLKQKRWDLLRRLTEAQESENRLCREHNRLGQVAVARRRELEAKLRGAVEGAVRRIAREIEAHLRGNLALYLHDPATAPVIVVELKRTADAITESLFPEPGPTLAAFLPADVASVAAARENLLVYKGVA